MVLIKQSGIIIQLLLIIIASQVYSAEFHVDISPFQIVEDNRYVKILLTSDKETYTSCEPIILSMTAVNIADSTMTFETSMSLGDDRFTFLICNNTGCKNPELTQYGRMLYQQLLFKDSHGGFTRLKPNDTYTKKFQIDRIYDMSLSGDYIISASFACFDLASKTESHPKSNSIQIKITDEDPPILNDSDTVVPFTLKVGTEMDTSPQGIKEETGTVQKP